MRSFFPERLRRQAFSTPGYRVAHWLYTFWHAGLPLAVIAYVLLRDADSVTSMSEHSLVAVIGLSVAVVIGTVCGLTWIATAGDWLLPRIFLDSVQGPKSHLANRCG